VPAAADIHLNMRCPPWLVTFGELEEL